MFFDIFINEDNNENQNILVFNWKTFLYNNCIYTYLFLKQHLKLFIKNTVIKYFISNYLNEALDSYW